MNCRSILLAVMLPVLVLLEPVFAADSDAAARRLVSTDAGVTEILLLLGKGGQLVAVDDSSELPAAMDLPRLGYHRALSAEGLIAMSPDLVIGSEHMGPPHVLEALDRIGIPVMQLPSPTTIGELRNNIDQVVTELGSDRGREVISALTGKQDALDDSLAGKQAAFLLRGEGGKLRMAGAGTAGGGFIGLLGADNIADYDAYRSVTPEALLDMQPDILLLADTEGGAAGDFLSGYPVLRFSPAVENGQVFMVDPATLVAGISVSAVDEALRVLEQAAVVTP